MFEIFRNHMVEPVDNDRFSPVGVTKFTTTEEFIQSKIEMLTEDFRIYLTEEDIDYLHRFTTEGDINAAVRTIINKYWSV